MFWQTRGRNQRRCILLNVPRARQPLEPAANGRKRPCRRSFGKSAIVERPQEGANVRVLNALHGLVCALARAEPLTETQVDPRGKPPQLAPVSAQRVRRYSSLIGQNLQEFRNQPINRRRTCRLRRRNRACSCRLLLKFRENQRLAAFASFHRSNTGREVDCAASGLDAARG